MARYTTSGQKTSLEALNAELEKIEIGQQGLLSRSGETPNQMTSFLDMNNNTIINLPEPTQPTDPVRLQDIIYPSGDVVLTSDLTKSPTSVTGVLRAEDAYAATSINFHTGHAPDKSEVGLGNVDNTSDVNKPVSAAQSTAIGLKADTTALTAHTTDISNPHSVTQTQVGLSNVNNTSDVNKPVSTATQTALDLKASTTSLNTHINDAANPHSVTQAQVGLGNVNNTADADKPVSSATQTALNLKADTSALTTHVNDVTNPHSVTKTQVGLSNVNNTSDANKPVSTAQQTALDLKADRSSLNRQSLLDNPLCHLFKTNKLVETSAPTGTDSDITFTRASTATYVDRYGIVKTAAIDTIREEKDGFLIEQAGTNLVPYSEQFDNAVWIKALGASITPNVTTSPDGTVTADKIDFTNTNDRLFQAVANTTAASFTFSIWVKSTGADKSISLRLKNSPTATNFTKTNFTATSEWQRFSVTLASLAENLVCELISIAVNLDFFIWGAQLEQSLAATSYIPTVATPVTRIADKALLPVLNNVVTKEFSIFGIITNLSSVTTTGNKFIFRMPVATGFLALFYNAGSPNQFNFRYDDGSAAAQATVVVTENIKYFVLTVDDSNVKLNINGTEVTATKLSDPSLLLANNVPFFSSTGVAVSNGNIKDFRIYDFALNANEIEYLLP